MTNKIVVIFPRRNDNASSSNSENASLYLRWHKPNSAADNNNDYKLYACAQFLLCLSSPRHPTNYAIKSN